MFARHSILCPIFPAKMQVYMSNTSCAVMLIGGLET
ncbi:hypothetical protein ACP70R_035193 [Stipagrostis hirtigluma subsp. patula]